MPYIHFPPHNSLLYFQAAIQIYLETVNYTFK